MTKVKSYFPATIVWRGIKVVLAALCLALSIKKVELGIRTDQYNVIG